MQVNPLGSTTAPQVIPTDSLPARTGLSAQANQGIAAVATQLDSAVQALNGNAKLREPTQQETAESVEKLNQLVKTTNQSLQFSVDDETNLKLVKLIDLSTKETIRQFPSEEIVNIAKAIDKFQGMLVREKV